MSIIVECYSFADDPYVQISIIGIEADGTRYMIDHTEYDGMSSLFLFLSSLQKELWENYDAEEVAFVFYDYSHEDEIGGGDNEDE